MLDPALSALPRLLTTDDAVVAVASGRADVVAVPDAARPLFAAAVHELAGIRPVLVAVPTVAEAERIAGDPAPAIVVAPVRALVQRLGPHVEDSEPVHLRVGDAIDRDELVERLIGMGYRREYQVEGRGEVAVRGSIVAVYPCRELLPTAEVRARAEALLTEAPWGREQWERLAQGQVFDGMESWLPWLTAEEHLLPDLLPAGARVLLVEPRRMRDRAQALLDEEAALAETLAGTWDATGHEFPRLSLPFDRLLARTHTATTSVLAAPDGPDTPQLAAAAFDPVVGDVEALAERIRALVRAEHRVVLAAEGEGSARRLADVLAGEGIDALVDGRIAPGSVTVVVAPLERGVVLAGAHLALVAEADLTGRRRVHRTARGARKAVDYDDDLKPDDLVVHQVHGAGCYEG